MNEVLHSLLLNDDRRKASSEGTELPDLVGSYKACQQYYLVVSQRVGFLHLKAFFGVLVQVKQVSAMCAMCQKDEIGIAVSIRGFGRQFVS